MLDLPDVHQVTADMLGEQLEQVTLIFERQLASDLSAVNRLCLHVEQYRGKMLRPTLVLLTGLACSREPENGASLTDAHRIIAAVTEMIHMATLVHDDVLDEAEIRRRGGTVNHLWGNETAVMLGDYLISNSFHLCSTIGIPDVNVALGVVTNTLCAGELMQLHHRDDYGLDESTYFQIVQRKTASLIGACCALGAQLSGADETTIEAMRAYGMTLGTAFQIRDDLLDLVGEQSVVGKSLGRDLAKGKITLPVIYYLADASQEDRGRMLRTLVDRDARTLRSTLVDSGAVERTEATARRLVDEARASLPALQTSGAVDLMAHLADTVASRSF